MKLIAKKALIYSGKRIKAGDEFTAERRFGNLFVAIGKAKIAPPVEEPEPVKLEQAEPEPEPKPPRPRHSYRRRDMKAENESEG